MPEHNDESMLQPSATNHNQFSDQKPEPPPDPKKRRRTTLLCAGVAMILIGVGLVWWLHSRTYESTDDAQVDGHLNPIATRVDGTVSAVYVENNQSVKAGQPILELDRRDAEISLTQAQADYDQAVAQLQAEVPNVPIQHASNRSDVASAKFEIVNDEAAVQGAQHDYESDVAKLRQAQATSEKSQNDLVRYKQLVDKEELAQSDYDQYVSTAKSNAASVDAAAATVASQMKLIDQRRAQLQEQQAKAAQAIQNAPQQIAIKKQTMECVWQVLNPTRPSWIRPSST